MDPLEKPLTILAFLVGIFLAMGCALEASTLLGFPGPLGHAAWAESFYSWFNYDGSSPTLGKDLGVALLLGYLDWKLLSWSSRTLFRRKPEETCPSDLQIGPRSLSIRLRGVTNATRRGASLLLRLLALVGHLAVLFFSLGAVAYSSSLGAGVVAVASIGLTVVTLRHLFPWPRREEELTPSLTWVRASLRIALGLGVVCILLSHMGVDSLADWRPALGILSATCILDLWALKARGLEA